MFTGMKLCRRGAPPAQRKNATRAASVWHRPYHLLTLFVIVATAGAICVYGYPPRADSSGADLVLVLGPPTSPRIQLAQSMVDARPATKLLISVAPNDSGTPFTAAKMPICENSGVTCMHAKPFTTKGEALMLVDYARTHDVHKVAVITFTPHVARTRYIFARCAPDIDVQVIGVDQHLTIGDWVYQFAYQTTAFAKAIATPCASDDE